MNATLCKNIDWVGAVDFAIRDFHSYDTERGATYNSYLIRDDKVALIDTVKSPFADELLTRVAALVDLSRVDYVVCNHAELDHSGALPQVLRAMPRATLVCDRKCATTLAEHFDTSQWNIRIVASGETLTLGHRSLQFIETPMVHWPESMFTYVSEEKLLFSMDAFGQHYATDERFDDEADMATVMHEAKTYYANIILPYGKAVKSCLQSIAGIDLRMIAPSHGLIWRSHGRQIIEAYHRWASHRPLPKVLILYDTMWESTASMAEAILAGASQPGVTAVLVNIRQSNLTRIAGEVLDAAAVAIGSSTLNRGMMPMVAATLSYFEGLRPAGKAATAFGSFGWGKGGPEAIDAVLRALDWDVIGEPIRSRYRPTPETLAQCRQTGELLAERARTLAIDKTP